MNLTPFIPRSKDHGFFGCCYHKNHGWSKTTMDTRHYKRDIMESSKSFVPVLILIYSCILILKTSLT